MVGLAMDVDASLDMQGQSHSLQSLQPLHACASHPGGWAEVVAGAEHSKRRLQLHDSHRLQHDGFMT